MSATNLPAIAASLYKAGITGDPTAILARELELFEVEFEALECMQESELRSADWAVLALARALGRISPVLIDEYLGLGDTVSEAIVQRLLSEQLLQRDGAEPAQADVGLLALAKRFLTWGLSIGAAPAPPTSPRARKLHASRALESPLCYLSDLGNMALERRAIPQRRVHKARLVFLAEPLLFIKVEDDRQQRYTARHRTVPLPPEEVPPSLRTLDSSLSLPADRRMAACGIGTDVAGLTGQLVGIVPGSQWEVRRLGRRVDGQYQTQTATLVLAAFHAMPDELRWHTFLQQGGKVQAYPQIDAAQLIDARARRPAGLLAAVHSELPLPASILLRDDGAYEVPCDGRQMASMLGEGDRPCDSLLQARLESWHAGLRVHATPADCEAAHHAFYALLSRSDAALRRHFDATCATVAGSLAAYWGRNDYDLPSADEAAVNLWPQIELRAALCMRRLQRDLVSSYAEEQPA
ncbi:hypothetical protein [Achromobacter spanius]|uniref:Uncharacterized protein n=1 Tax=Achromobacter spanius TaxID=217203 RepID=A0AAW3I148_9BURK|nr:hypothetical protein [Achromobacter spanius]KNE26479.1 hypothetical protein AFM18_17375 [Achromobacter spanius]